MGFLIVVAVIGGLVLYYRRKKRIALPELSGWKDDFLLFFVCSKAILALDSRDTHHLRILMSGRIDFSTEQALLANLHLFAGHVGASVNLPNDFRLIVASAPHRLRWFLAGYNSPASIRAYVTEEQETRGEEITHEETERAVEALRSGLAQGGDEANEFDFELFRRKIGKEFHKRFDANFETYYREFSGHP